ncbi:MAG: dUTP diphosphatase [Patescibacteria group bacterium]|nr:MAG: dUTP diphosphatase [Patescibacteria group bacterium]
MSASETPSDLEELLQILRDPRAKALQPEFRPSKDGDAGYNLYCIEETVIPPGLRPPVDLPTGIRVKLPKGCFARIEPRSSLYLRYPTLELCSAPIDNGYTGPLDPRFRNRGRRKVVVPAGESLVQLVLYRLIVPETSDVDALPETARGADRYGSTGK